MEQQICPFNRGDRVEVDYYGVGTVRHLDGDLAPDGEHYDWPGYVCVEFDREVNGKKILQWYEYKELRRLQG